MLTAHTSDIECWSTPHDTYRDLLRARVVLSNGQDMTSVGTCVHRHESDSIRLSVYREQRLDLLDRLRACGVTIIYDSISDGEAPHA